MTTPPPTSFEQSVRAAMTYAVEHAYIGGRYKEPLVIGDQVAAILAAHRAELVAELTWARSQAPRLHDESETVDKWDCEHYRSLLTERIAALTDNTKEAERD